MKKAKIFLSAIAVLAVIGGAFAFKAKTYGQLFCTRLLAHGAGVCEGPYTGRIRLDNSKCYYYTSTDDQTRCGQIDCTTSTCLTNVE